MLFSRLENPSLFAQLTEFIRHAEAGEEERLKQETFTLIKTLAGGMNLFRDSLGNAHMVKEGERPSFSARTRDEIEKDLRDRIERQKTQTTIEFSDDISDAGRICVGQLHPVSGKRLSTRQMCLAEAHEKGHEIRPLDGTFFKSYFSAAFDEAPVSFSPVEMEMYCKLMYPPSDGAMPEPDTIKQQLIEYLFSPHELMERMSQLKKLLWHGWESNIHGSPSCVCSRPLYF